MVAAMSAPTLTREGEIFVVNFGDDENRTDHEWVAGMNRLLDEVEATDGPKVLMTTGSGKHYSNGLDVDWMGGRDSDEIVGYVNTVEEVLGRILTFPAPTVAAVNGHAFGAGAFAVIAHDHAVMRDDRGFVCWPEVHLGMGFSPGLMSMVTHLMSTAAGWEAVVTGRRYGAADAVEAGIVDRAVPLDQLLPVAGELGLPHASTAGDAVGRIKRHLHRDVITTLATA
jgi:enoyl-CoA hydratase/carnithine racemase